MWGYEVSAEIKLDKVWVENGLTTDVVLSGFIIWYWISPPYVLFCLYGKYALDTTPWGELTISFLSAIIR